MVTRVYGAYWCPVWNTRWLDCPGVRDMLGCMVVLSRYSHNWRADLSLTVDRADGYSWLVLLDSLYNSAVHDRIMVDGSVLSLVEALGRIHDLYGINVSNWVWIGHVLQDYGYSYPTSAPAHHVCAFSNAHSRLSNTASDDSNESTGMRGDWGPRNDGWVYYHGAPMRVVNHTSHGKHQSSGQQPYAHDECPYAIRHRRNAQPMTRINGNESFSLMFRICFLPESCLFGYEVSIVEHNQLVLHGYITHGDGITYDELVGDLAYEYDNGRIRDDYLLDILDALVIMSPLFRPGTPTSVAREDMMSMFPALAEPAPIMEPVHP